MQDDIRRILACWLVDLALWLTPKQDTSVVLAYVGLAKAMTEVPLHARGESPKEKEG